MKRWLEKLLQEREILNINNKRIQVWDQDLNMSNQDSSQSDKNLLLKKKKKVLDLDPNYKNLEAGLEMLMNKRLDLLEKVWIEVKFSKQSSKKMTELKHTKDNWLIW